jgi:hypothetical protein
MNAPEFRLTREHSETVPTWRVWLDTGDAELCAGKVAKTATGRWRRVHADDVYETQHKAATACVEAFLGVTA